MSITSSSTALSGEADRRRPRTVLPFSHSQPLPESARRADDSTRARLFWCLVEIEPEAGVVRDDTEQQQCRDDERDEQAEQHEGRNVASRPALSLEEVGRHHDNYRRCTVGALEFARYRGLHALA